MTGRSYSFQQSSMKPKGVDPIDRSQIHINVSPFVFFFFISFKQDFFPLMCRKTLATQRYLNEKLAPECRQQFARKLRKPLRTCKCDLVALQVTRPFTLTSVLLAVLF